MARGAGGNSDAGRGNGPCRVDREPKAPFARLEDETEALLTPEEGGSLSMEGVLIGVMS